VAEGFGQKKDKTRKIEEINGRGLIFEKFFSLREDEEEMKQERGKGKKSNFIKPVEEAVQKIQLACRRKSIERVKDKRDQIEIDIGHRKGLLGIEKNNKAYDQSGQTNESQIKIDEVNTLLHQIKGGIDEFPLPVNLINDFLTGTGCYPEIFGDIYFVLCQAVVDGIEDIPLLDTSQIGRAVSFHFQRLKAICCFFPENAICRLFPGDFFVNVQTPQDEEDRDGNNSQISLFAHWA